MFQTGTVHHLRWFSVAVVLAALIPKRLVEQTGVVTTAAAPSQYLHPHFLPSLMKAVKKVHVLQMITLLIPEIKVLRNFKCSTMLDFNSLLCA